MINLDNPKSRLFSQAFQGIRELKQDINIYYARKFFKLQKETIRRLDEERKQAESKANELETQLLQALKENEELKKINNNLIEGL